MTLTYFQAIFMGLFQGVAELFPISSLGHAVLIANLFGWRNLLEAESQKESFFLSFLVVLHLATATALLIFYRKEWTKIVAGFWRSIQRGKISEPYEKLAWLLIAASVPAGIIGLLFEQSLRTLFAKPTAAALFLVVNGLILFAGDKAHHFMPTRRKYGFQATTEDTTHKLTFRRAMLIGIAQVAAFCAGISRSGVTMVVGLYGGLSYEAAARFSFLLATPIIFAAGLYKLPVFLGHESAGARSQMLAGALAAGIAAYLAVKFLDRYFQTKKLTAFAWYCLGFGVFMLLWQLFFGA